MLCCDVPTLGLDTRDGGGQVEGGREERGCCSSQSDAASRGMKVINLPVNCTNSATPGPPGDSASPYATLFLCNIIRNMIRCAGGLRKVLVGNVINI